MNEGAETWNKWRHDTRTSRPDLSGADLSEKDLSFFDLSGTDLRKAQLINASFIEANLTRANLQGADLAFADLSTSELIRTNLVSTQLLFANLTNADLSRADLTNARLLETAFIDADLTAVKGLDACVHLGPSTVDHRTVMKSGPLPVAFLRGCGMPETLIEFLGKPLEFNSCFISFSERDREFADRIHADLEANGVTCWFAPHHMHGGRKIHEQIDQAIRTHDRLLLILSEHSMNSNWVETEISKAHKRELSEKRQMLFPVRLVSFEALKNWECFDADTGKDSAREIREYFIPDFSNWKNHDYYKRAFDRLLRDLKAQPDGAAKPA
jgi:uncharacterized protein YjbI with pentapeptide repeats